MSMVHSGWAPKWLSIAKISETMTNLVTVSLLANSLLHVSRAAAVQGDYWPGITLTGPKVGVDPTVFQ